MRAFSPHSRPALEDWFCPLSFGGRDAHGFERRNLCSIAATTAALVAGGLAAAGAIGGSAIQAHAASSAANTQEDAASTIAADAKTAAASASGDVNAATTTANQTISDSNTSLDAAKAQQLAALAPYIQAGTVSLSQVQDLLSSTGPLAGPGSQFNFTPANYDQNDPGYQYQVAQSQQALQRSQAAQGILSTGGTVKASARLSDSLASTHLNDAFNRALQTYTTNRQTTLDQLQGLQGVAQLGLQGTSLQNQDIGNTAQLENANQNKVAQNTISEGEYAGNVGLSAEQIAAQAQAGAAAASGAGQIGVANATNSGIGNTLKALTPVIYSVPQTTSSGGSSSGGAGYVNGPVGSGYYF